MGIASMVLAPIPTSRLRWEIAGIERAGTARITHAKNAIELPTEHLQSWMGRLDEGGETVASRALTQAASASLNTVHRDGMQFFAPHQVLKSFAPMSTWTTDLRKAARYGTDSYLFARERVGDTAWHYFICRASGGRIATESRVSGDIVRLMHSLALISGRPFLYEFNEKTVQISIGHPLPSSEFRLFRALTRELGRGRDGRTFGLPLSVAETLCGVLENLGCKRSYK
jgi:hypothetical protein